MAARVATAAQTAQRAQRELQDLQLVLRARNGDEAALDQLMRRYTGFVRLKASSYFLAGGDLEDLIQEGLIGLYKAVRDSAQDKETSVPQLRRAVVTRQIITRSRRRRASSISRSTSTSRSATRRRGRTPTASARSATRCQGRLSKSPPSS